MTDFDTQTAQQIMEVMAKSQRVLLHLHASPDPDSMGSALVLYHYLTSQGKQVTLIQGDSQVPAYLQVFPGAKIVAPQSYPETDISQFDAFISTDTSSLSKITRVQPIEFPPHLYTVSIDHHASHTHFAQLNLVSTTHISTTHLLYDLFSYFHLPLTREIALCMLLGMYSDTIGFKSPHMTPDGFSAAHDLSQMCPDYSRFIIELESNYSPQNMKYLGLALTHTQVPGKGKMVISAVGYSELQKEGLSVTDTEGMKGIAANTLLTVYDWILTIAAVETRPGVTNVSIRSRYPDRYSCSAIASKIPGGGGHPVAAGATLSMSVEPAVEELLHTVRSTYPDLID